MRTFKKLEELTHFDYRFIHEAERISINSKAIDRKVGAIIANHITGEPLSYGYNKMFDSMKNQSCEDENGESLPYVIHAEESAVIKLLKSQGNNIDYLDITIYCSYAPCHNCCKYISHLGIKRIVYSHKHLTKFDNCENSPMQFLNDMGFEVIEAQLK